MRSSIIAIIGLAVFAGTALFLFAKNDQAIDWKAAYDHAKSGKSVKLTIVDASTPDFVSFNVFLRDGWKEENVGSAAFATNKPASFNFDLSPILKTLDKAPSKGASIVLRTDKRLVRVKYSSIKVELVK